MAEKSTATSGRAALRRHWFRFYGLLLIVIFLKPFSNLFLAWGMKHFPEALASDPILYVRAVFDPLVAAGILMQIVWLLMRMALLSVADLSFVLPVTAVGYVISTVLAHVFLNEQVSLTRWAGTGLIFLGTAVVGLTLNKGMRTERSR